MVESNSILGSSAFKFWIRHHFVGPEELNAENVGILIPTILEIFQKYSKNIPKYSGFSKIVKISTNVENFNVTEPK